MTYAVGVDLGTTFTAAAVGRAERVEMVNLGAAAAAVPSVLYLGLDGAVAVGEPALRRLLSEPDRVAREFKRRIGDPAPLHLGGTPIAAHLVGARVLRWVLDLIAEREGGPPEHVVVTHPANWGEYKREHHAQLLAAADTDAEALTEPEAAAIGYAASERVEPGEIIAVYDLGGGTFDTSVLRRSGSGFEMLGEPQGVEHLGGLDFDEAIFGFVSEQLDGAVDDLDADDPDAVTSVQRLREECVGAKIALSSDGEAVVPVVLPGRQARIRITRREFETLISPLLSDTITSLRRALRSAHVNPSELGRVLLVGGSSRIPLVGQLVTSELNRPVAVDADPKNLIARGAAHHAMRTLDDIGDFSPPTRQTSPLIAAPVAPAALVDEADTVAEPEPVPAPVAEQPVEPSTPETSVAPVAPVVEAPAAAGAPPRAPIPAKDGQAPERTPRRVGLLAGIGAAVVLAVVAAALLLGGGDGDDDGGDVATGDTTTTTGEAPPPEEDGLPQLLDRPAEEVAVEETLEFDEVPGRPFVSERAVYVPFPTHILVLDAETLEEVARLPIPEQSLSPIEAGDEVWVGLGDGTIATFDIDTHEDLGRIQVGSSPGVTEFTIGDEVWFLDQTATWTVLGFDREIKAKIPLEQADDVDPHDTVFFGKLWTSSATEPHLVSVDIESHEVVAAAGLPSEVLGLAAVGDELWAGGVDGTDILDPETARALAPTRTLDIPAAVIYATDEVVFLVNPTGAVLVDPGTGVDVDSIPSDATPRLGLVGSDVVIHHARQPAGDALVVLDSATGEQLKRVDVGTNARLFVLFGGRVYVTDGDEKVLRVIGLD